MKKIGTFSLLIAVLTIGNGCTKIEPAPEIAQALPIIPMETASKAMDEPVPIQVGAMPCLQFKDKDGFGKWLEAYRAGEPPEAMELARSIHLPEPASEAQTELWSQALMTDNPKISICTIHQGLQLSTWAIQEKEVSKIYVYWKENWSHLEIPIRQKISNKPFCLPEQVTNNEFIWSCTYDFKDPEWTQVHVNRKSGEMKAIACKKTENGQLLQGCLNR